MADAKQQAAQRAASIKAQREADQKLTQHGRAQYEERMKGHPTPTQDECDRIKLGENIPHKQPSGAGPDPRVQRQLSGEGGGGGYQTRQVRAGAPTPRTSAE